MTLITTRELTDQIIGSDLVWPRAVMIKYLKSYFLHAPEFNRENYKYDEDMKKTDIAVIDNHTILSDVNESADRVIIQRQAYNEQTIITDNRTWVDNDMFTHSIVKPRLGYLSIYCESQIPAYAEFITSQVEMAILMHKEDLAEQNLGIGALTMSDVRKPVSGTKFFSMRISIPTIVVSEAEFSVTNPQMLNSLEIELGIGSAFDIKVKTD
jgi:hypothetical protein